MSNKSVVSTIAHAVNGINLPEVASRQDWKVLAKSLHDLQASSGLIADDNKDMAFACITSAAYALLIRSTLDGDEDIYKHAALTFARIPSALDKKGMLKGRYALKIAALQAACNAAKDQRKKLAKSEVIKTSELFNSEGLHAALVALQPVVKVTPVIKAVKVAALITGAVVPDEKLERSLAFGHEYHEDMLRSSDASRIQAEFNLESEKQAAKMALQAELEKEIDFVAMLQGIAVNRPDYALGQVKAMALAFGYTLTKKRKA